MSTMLPTRQNVSINALDDMHNMLKERLISELKNSAGNSKMMATIVSFILLNLSIRP